MAAPPPAGEAPDPPDPAGASPIYEPETVAELEAVFGRARLMSLLAGLRAEIGRRLCAPGAPREDLSRDAHALVSASGTLGFQALSRACAALEEACHAGEEPGPALAAARRAGAATLEAIDRLLAEPR
ncbi:Hpt domain-containing protein [Methylobacterium nigriterrae]|uniref:Hpt domain-containing protein n=1 Tax=Methylobacterium nigriterrae TaxID=3127512 RepID=UPI0030136C54